MERKRSSHASLIVCTLLTGLISQNLVIPVISTTIEDQTNHYTPDPHAGSPPTSLSNSLCNSLTEMSILCFLYMQCMQIILTDISAFIANVDGFVQQETILKFSVLTLLMYTVFTSCRLTQMSSISRLWRWRLWKHTTFSWNPITWRRWKL